MAPRPPPRFVVQAYDLARQRQLQRWLLLGWPLSVVLAIGLTLALAPRRASSPTAHEGRAAPAHDNHAAKQLSMLRQQVADLQRSQQVNDVAMKALRTTLTEREEEISGLRADLGFYARLVGGDGQRDGLKVQEVKADPVPQSRAWNFTISLTQSARRSDEIDGLATLSVEGLRGDKVEVLDWPALGDTAHKGGLPFHLKYFQQLHTTLVLPAGFRPMRVSVKAKPGDGQEASRSLSWKDAVRGTITTNGPGDTHAQP